MGDSAAPPCLYVLAGTNGGGKSSVGGAAIRARGADYFNPDEAARVILAANPGTTQRDANMAAWQEGRRLLETAIARRLTYAFETTLGGDTITALLQQALADRIEVRMWYVALASADLHVARVRARVARGGHDIPEETIRRRYDQSRLNLIRLLPALTTLRVFDNSEEGDPAAGVAPRPRLVMAMAVGVVESMCELAEVPAWARPIAAAALAGRGR